ncbi:MAG: type II toxin-antitoxin system HicA family toxin [Aeromonas sp.]
MKSSEFRRWLMSQGIEIKSGAKHDKLRNPANGKASHLPRHGSEIGEGLRRAIIKQLGL